MDIIELALIFVPLAALICLLLNLDKYIAARKKQENVKIRTKISLAVSSCMIAATVILVIVFGGDMFHM